MLSLISYATISSSADLFFGQHRLRHQEFIERQNYAVKTIDGMEFDQYDTLASKYLVYCEDGKRVLGCSRLTPTRLGSMLQDHFAGLVLDHAIFSEPDTWEGTRFCVDSTLPADKRLHILRQIAVGYTASSQASQQAEQARLAARTSQVFFAQSAADGEKAAAVTAPNSAMPLGSWSASAQPDAAKSDAEKKASFLDQAPDSQITSRDRFIAPVSPYTLLTGSVVPAALITGLRSDIPGQVLAQVTQDVRDSLTGRYVLIPRGSRLIGQYDNSISFGQSRILLVWSRLILPNGRSLRLEKVSAADARGYAGLTDRVDNHWAAVINAAALSTLLGIGAQTSDSQSDNELVRALRDGAADSINRTGQRIVERQLDVRPTLTVRAGMPVRVILSRDLILEPYGD